MSKWGPMPADLQAARRVVVSRNIMIPMRDGKRLATDIYRPALDNGDPAPGPFPVILTRTSYDKSNPVMQVEPVGVLVPASDADVRAAFDVCRELRVPMLPRGAGSSQCGQTVGAALVIDHSKHLNKVVAFDADLDT